VQNQETILSLLAIDDNNIDINNTSTNSNSDTVTNNITRSRRENICWHTSIMTSSAMEAIMHQLLKPIVLKALYAGYSLT
jgi:hypothetical protein